MIIYRYVNIIEKEIEVILTLGKTLNTIKMGENFTPANCTVLGKYSGANYNCELDISDVDTSKEGTYEVIYYVMIDDIRYEEISYVFVYDSSDALIWYYDKSRRGYL